VRAVLALLGVCCLSACSLLFPFDGDVDADADGDADADSDADADADADADGCTPGVLQNEPCGMCGTRTRTCQADRTWGAYNDCSQEGECLPGSTEWRDCTPQGGYGATGREFHECRDDCTWGEWGSCA